MRDVSPRPWVANNNSGKKATKKKKSILKNRDRMKVSTDPL